MSRIKRALALLSALLLLLPSLSLAEEESLYTGAAVEYETDTAEYGLAEVTMLGNAELTYPREADIRYEGEVYSYFERFAVIKDGAVKKGDVIAVVRGTVSKADSERARLQLLRAEEEYERTVGQNEQALRDMTLQLQSANSEVEKEKARLSIEKQKLNSELYIVTAERSIKALKENYETLSSQGALIEIVSPADGIVKNTRDYSYGDTVYSGAVLATLYVTTDLLIRVSSRWGTPSYGTKVTVNLGSGANAKTLTGTVVAADNMLSSMDKTGKTYVRLDSDEKAEYGQSITVYYPLFSMNNVLLVNAKAVYSDGNKAYVYVLKDGTRQKKYVTVAFRNSVDAWILDGLTAGDVVTLH